MEELKVHETEVDYGVVLYENSNAKSVLDAPTGKVGAKGWAQRIYMIILAVLLFGWFLYSLIHKASQPDVGFGKAVVEHIAAFFLLLMAEVILMLTAFNAWGKFARAVLKHKSLTRKHGIEGAQTRQLEAELQAADANKAKEDAVLVYRDYIVVVNRGETTTIDRSQLRRVSCKRGSVGYHVCFDLYDDTQVMTYLQLPISEIPFIKKHFDNFEYTPAQREKGYFKKKFPMLIFAFLPLLLGIAILILRSLVLQGMPIIFGIVFMAFGVVFITAQFSDIAVIGHGVLTILGGILLVGLPLGIALQIVDLVEEISLVNVLTTFTPFHAVFSVFLGFGPMLIIIGISAICDCAKL
ncbi:MAG: hypothetical protein J1F68_00690 [Clostridiales bacterium]|nr:hypothetical protein [Clostridiales bacterium]